MPVLPQLLHPHPEASLLEAEPALTRDVTFGPSLADLPHASDPADALAWPPAPPRFALALAALAMASVTLAALVVLPASLAPGAQVDVMLPTGTATTAIAVEAASPAANAVEYIRPGTTAMTGTQAPGSVGVDALGRDPAPIRFARASAHHGRQER